VTEIVKWSIFTLYLLFILIFLYLRKDKLQKDFFLLVFLFQITIYIFVAPNIYSMNIEEDRVNTYSTIQLLCFLFYVLPLLSTYYFLSFKKENTFEVKKYESSLSKLTITKNYKLIFLLLLCFLILSLTFVYVALNYNLLFRRIGHEALYDMTSDVPRLLYYPYKIFSELGLFIIILIYIIKINCKQNLIYFLSKLSLIVYIITYGGFVLINNRLQTLILIFTIFGFNLIVRNKKKIFTRNTLIIILISIYLLKVIVNVRNNFVDNDGNIKVVEVINPFYQTQLDENDPLSNRLNGIDLISIYYPKMFYKGFTYFDPWIHSVKIFFGSILNTDYYIYCKTNMITNARSIIVKKYLDMSIIDYNQCQLTDVFAVMGPFSLFFVSIFTAYLFSIIINGFYYSKNIFKILIFILMIPFVLEFEKDFMNLAIGWLKYLPIAFIIYKLNIYKFEYKKQ
jgi:hypothetical protein